MYTLKNWHIELASLYNPILGEIYFHFKKSHEMIASHIKDHE